MSAADACNPWYRVQDPEQDLSKPARKQVDKPVVREEEPRSAATHNLWTGRRLGGKCPERERKGSQHRCRPKVDVGKTRGSQACIQQFCLYFARGLCAEGSLCTYLHRLPTSKDEAAFKSSPTQDIFGRGKLPDTWDNRKGAGSYERDTHTLYVQYEGAGHIPLPRLRTLLEANFGEWGPLQHIYIVPNKTIAFVRFEWRVTAEFAKEAMNGQTLDGSSIGEALKLRWASEDPNPMVIALKKRDAAVSLLDAVHDSFQALPPEEKRARLAAMQLEQAAAAPSARVNAVATAYPSTDGQYASAAPSFHGGPPPEEAGGQLPGEEAEGAYPDTDAQYGAAAGSSGGGMAAAAAAWAGAGAPAGAGAQAVDWAAAAQQYPGYYDAQGNYHWFSQEQQQQQQQPGGAGAAAAASALAGGAGPASASSQGAAAQPTAPDPLGMLAGYGSSDDEEESGGQGDAPAAQASGPPA